MDVLERQTKKAQGNDSVEGIAYSSDKAVIMTGTFVEADEVFVKELTLLFSKAFKFQIETDKVNNMGLWYKPWFYHYVENFLSKGRQVKVENYQANKRNN